MQKLFLILIIVITIISFNLFLEYSPFSYSVSPVVYDKKIGMWHKKNYSNYAIQPCYKNFYTFNKEGLPINVYPYDSTKKDIVLLGDSFVEAIMIKNKNIIHNSLAREYHGQYNFLNYGLSATNPIQQYNILKNKVNFNNVKTVLHFINLTNDLEGILDKNRGKFSRAKVYMDFEDYNDFNITPPRAESYVDKITDTLGNFQLYFYLKRLGYYIKNDLFKTKELVKQSKTKTDDSQIPLTVSSKQWLYLNGSIFQTKQILAKHHVQYKVIIFSAKVEYKKTIKKFFQKQNIDFVFLEKIMAKRGMKLETFKCDEHWNNQTHQSIAKVLKEIDFI